jgi:hypothetical protein
LNVKNKLFLNYFKAKIASISIAEFEGRLLTPIVDLVGIPISPNTSTIKSEAPFATLA